MTKMIKLFFLSSMACGALFAEEIGESAVPVSEVNEQQEPQSELIDPNTTWKEIQESWENGNVLKSVFSFLVFLKKQQDAILNNQGTIIMNQNTILANQSEFSKRFDRNEAGIKHLYSLFTQENRPKGG